MAGPPGWLETAGNPLPSRRILATMRTHVREGDPLLGQLAVPGEPAVCDTLLDLRAGLGRYATGFDAALLSGPQAQSVIEAATAVERMAAVLTSILGPSAGRSVSWR
ncbi:MAG: hypothetical protein LC808_34530 [Actinobacteria bacterium]|nr:hypothetical protein [Actinomycetota bacterium]